MEINWAFDPEHPSGAATGGDLAIHAFRPTLASFVREVLQNANDEHLENSEDPVHVEFRLIRLTSKHVKSFLTSMQWLSLRPHLAAAAKTPNGLTISAALESLDAAATLDLLLIADSRTNGLLGPERRTEVDANPGRNNFLALCKDKLFGDKANAFSGGTNGLGKAVLWCFSSLATVLFVSNPVKILTKHQSCPRFIGRCNLPWHKLDDGSAWDGSGWFGSVVNAGPSLRAESLWGSAASELTKQLSMVRGTDSGTSILIVGFREPAHEDRTPLEIAEDIRKAASSSFWPSLGGIRPSIELTIAVQEDGHEIRREDVVIETSDKPLADAYRSYLLGEIKSELQNPGDVVAVPIPIKVPKRIDGSKPGYDAEAALVVRVLSDEECKQSASRNTVSFFRSARMIVKTESVLGLPVNALPFVAILVCGRAKGDSPADEALEEFLRFSEPPEHDGWEVTRKIKDRFKTPYAEQLNSLSKIVKQRIRDLVRQRTKGGTPGPRLLMQRLPIGEVGGGKQPQKFSFRGVKAKLNPKGYWQFEGVAELLTETDKPWEIYVDLRFVEEGGSAAERGMIGKIKCDTCSSTISNGKATINVPSEFRTIRFAGESDPLKHPVASRDAVIEVALDASVGGKQ